MFSNRTYCLNWNINALHYLFSEVNDLRPKRIDCVITDVIKILRILWMILHYEQGKPLNDIAKEMGLSLSTVQNYINKAIKKIKEYFMKKK
jgi:predicted DNA-binding protein (UPF0251 family)